MNWLEQLLINIAILFGDTTCCGFRVPPSPPPKPPIRTPFNSPIPFMERPIFYRVPSVSEDSFDEREMDRILSRGYESDMDDDIEDDFEVIN